MSEGGYDDDAEERRRMEQLRRDLEAYEQWRLLPHWKRKWYGDKSHEDLLKLDKIIDIVGDDTDKLVKLLPLADRVADIEKSIRLAKATETAGKFWKKGIMAFLGGVLVFGPGMKMLIEIYEYFAALFRKAGGP